MRLTERRLAKIKPIVENYRGQFAKRGLIDSSSFEHELRQELGTGYQEIKGIVIALLEIPRYRTVAAYYMQHQNAPAPVSDFKPHLAALYGDEAYDPSDASGKRKKYWDRVNSRRRSK